MFARQYTLRTRARRCKPGNLNLSLVAIAGVFAPIPQRVLQGKSPYLLLVTKEGATALTFARLRRHGAVENVLESMGANEAAV
eukprot:g28450.t1